MHSGCDHASLLLGPGGSKIRKNEYEVDGLGSILARDDKRTGTTERCDIKNEQLHVLLRGEYSCADRAETIFCDILHIQNSMWKTFYQCT